MGKLGGGKCFFSQQDCRGFFANPRGKSRKVVADFTADAGLGERFGGERRVAAGWRKNEDGIVRVLRHFHVRRLSSATLFPSPERAFR